MTIKYLGNYPNWVNPHHLKIILESEGDKRTAYKTEKEIEKQEQVSIWSSLGHELKGAEWFMYYYGHLGMSAVTDLQIPIDIDGPFNWWYSKINPGSVFPLHVDTFDVTSNKTRRLWIPMQDYQPGHIFIYEGKMLDDYRAGDVYEFENPKAWHGAANIGFEPKISLQLVIR